MYLIEHQVLEKEVPEFSIFLSCQVEVLTIKKNTSMFVIAVIYFYSFYIVSILFKIFEHQKPSTSSRR